MTNAARVPQDAYVEPLAREVLTGLRGMPKSIPCTWLYDLKGSELFESITALPEYYPTRTELAILQEHLPRFGQQFGRHAGVVEIGAGSGRKTRLLLSALRDPYAYLPVDISAEFLLEATSALQEAFPKVRCTPLVLDFTAPGALQAAAQRLPSVGPRLGFFPGSTIGNLTPDAVRRFLVQFGQALGSGATLLVGLDSTQDKDILIPAYDDSQGVTAAFNLNLLTRINRELAGTFVLERFRHEARYDSALHRVEMHLVSRVDQRVAVGSRNFLFRAGESIHTENSYKYPLQDFAAMAAAAGWQVLESWPGAGLGAGFAVHVLRRSQSS